MTDVNKAIEKELSRFWDDGYMKGKLVGQETALAKIGDKLLELLEHTSYMTDLTHISEIITYVNTYRDMLQDRIDETLEKQEK